MFLCCRRSEDWRATTKWGNPVGHTRPPANWRPRLPQRRSPKGSWRTRLSLGSVFGRHMDALSRRDDIGRPRRFRGGVERRDQTPGGLQRIAIRGVQVPEGHSDLMVRSREKLRREGVQQQRQALFGTLVLRGFSAHGALPVNPILIKARRMRRRALSYWTEDRLSLFRISSADSPFASPAMIRSATSSPLNR